MVEGHVFDTPRNYSLLLAARLPQHLAIAAAHQRKAALHQTNGTVAQVMSLPGAFGDTFGSEQNLGNRSVGVALGPSIERAQRHRQALPALRREFMESGTGCAPVERTPETPRGMRADLEIIIEGQFGCVRLADHRRLFQPEPMFDPANAQEDVPAIRRLPELARRQTGQTKQIPVSARCASNNRNNCRQNFRRPEYGLILRRPRGVSGESRGPISF